MEQAINSQLKRGALEMCVLCLLRAHDRYGYELTDAISKELDVAAGTLYLILKRLKADGQVDTYLVESSDGPARKYYRLTDTGRATAESSLAEWRSFVQKVDRLTKNVH